MIFDLIIGRLDVLFSGYELITEFNISLIRNFPFSIAGYHSGYTFNEGHYTPQKVKNPPKFVVEDSKDLIGQRTMSLI